MPGMQVMVIEFARNVLNYLDANSSEFDRSTNAPIIDLMPEQHDVTEKGGTMRLGLYPCHLVPGTKAGNAYQTDIVQERHRHRLNLTTIFDRNSRLPE